MEDTNNTNNTKNIKNHRIRLSPKGWLKLFTLNAGTPIAVTVKMSDNDTCEGILVIETPESATLNHNDCTYSGGGRRTVHNCQYSWFISRLSPDLRMDQYGTPEVYIDQNDFSSLGFVWGVDTQEVLQLNPSDSCSDCGSNLILIGNARRIGDSLLCDTCFSLYYMCEICKQSSKTVTEKYHICGDCIKEFIKCHDCQTMKHKNSMIELDSVYYCTDCAPSMELFDYHSGEGREDLAKKARLKVGFEIEKEDDNVSKSINASYLVTKTGWAFEEDGSLDDDCGFEAVSPILDLESDEQILGSLMSIEKYVNAKYTENCGGHIHVSDTTRTPQEIFDQTTGYRPLLFTLYPNRINKSYCAAKRKDEYTADSHDQAVNITDETVEFRIFPSPKNISVVMFRVKLLRYMLLNPADNPIKVLEQLWSKNSELYKLLRKVYTPEEIDERLSKFVKYAIEYRESKTTDIAEFSKRIGDSKSQLQKLNGILIEMQDNQPTKVAGNQLNLNV